VIARLKDDPVFGQGYGTRITESGLRQNAHVLDDEWLATTAETGLLGAFAWVWLFVRFVRRAGREAKRDLGSRGWFLTATASGVAAFGVSMWTYDAFSFIQVTFVLFILMALGASAMNDTGPWEPAARPPSRANLLRGKA
jgi:O-antigen ligase